LNLESRKTSKNRPKNKKSPEKITVATTTTITKITIITVTTQVILKQAKSTTNPTTTGKVLTVLKANFLRFLVNKRKNLQRVSKKWQNQSLTNSLQFNKQPQQYRFASRATAQ